MSQKKRALIVDDDDPIRTMLAKIVQRQDLEVDTARDGVEAIERLDGSGDYSVVVLDLMMPRVDGHGVLRFLERERNAPGPWVIVMTANLQSALESKQSRPVYRVLPKPFDIRDLIEHVRELQAPAQ